MEVIQIRSAVVVHKEQRLVDKLLQNVLHLLRLQLPQNTQHLNGGTNFIPGYPKNGFLLPGFLLARVKFHLCRDFDVLLQHSEVLVELSMLLG